MNGKIFIRKMSSTWHEFFPKVDEGISQAAKNQITRKLGTVPGVKNAKIIIGFDKVDVNARPGVSWLDDEEVAKTIASSLNWEGADLYDTFRSISLGSVRVPQPVTVSTEAIIPAYKKYYWGKQTQYMPNLPDDQMYKFEKPYQPKFYNAGLGSTKTDLVDRIMAIPGVREVMLSPDGTLLDVFKREAYSTYEVYPQVEKILGETVLAGKDVNFVKKF